MHCILHPHFSEQQIRNFVEGAQPDPPALSVFLEMMEAFLQGGDQVLAPENDVFGEVFQKEGNEAGKEKMNKPKGTKNNEIQGAKIIGEFAMARICASGTYSGIFVPNMRQWCSS